MNRTRLASALLLALALATPAVGSGQAGLKGRLVPIAPVRAGSGSFTASAVVVKGTATMKWQLSLSYLTGPATSATLRLTGLRGVMFVLCRPCSSSAHGKVGLVSAAWSNVLANGAQIVVATRAHPNGELRGTLSRG
jgi:hypothetical protein